MSLLAVALAGQTIVTAAPAQPGGGDISAKVLDRKMPGLPGFSARPDVNIPDGKPISPDCQLLTKHRQVISR